MSPRLHETHKDGTSQAISSSQSVEYCRIRNHDLSYVSWQHAKCHQSTLTVGEESQEACHSYLKGELGNILNQIIHLSICVSVCLSFINSFSQLDQLAGLWKSIDLLVD